jgi:hypothetical protein
MGVRPTQDSSHQVDTHTAEQYGHEAGHPRERSASSANPSEEGGLDEFDEFNPNRRFNWATCSPSLARHHLVLARLLLKSH